jgi:type II secretory pathway component PulF
MMETLNRALHPDSSQGIGLLLLGFLLYVVVALLPTCGLLYLLYFLLTLPMRRTERARMFLDLLELGLKEGRSPEGAIAEASASRDTSLGARFHLLAAHIEQGMGLSQALEEVPRLLPAQVKAMIATGEEIGNVAKVLPACRLLLQDSISHVRGAINYLVVLAFVTTPFTVFVPVMLRVKVLPSFRAVFDGVFEGNQLPALTRLVLAGNVIGILALAAPVILVWLVTILYLGGPRLRRWVELVLPQGERWVDALSFQVPWRRKRLQRDFSAMLAALLDANVPEPEAVRLAASATANQAFVARAERVRALLQQGAKLPEALREVDGSGELRWRLANALQRTGGFVKALSGWHEALDAKAFQQEQTAAQVTTTLLVLLNGAIVACFVIGMFVALIQLINNAILW